MPKIICQLQKKVNAYEWVTDAGCPECGKDLNYDPGEEQSFDNPGIPAGLYCSGPDCDFETEDFEIMRIP